MRVLIARCAVQYSGRLHTTLQEAVRAIIIKADGSVTVHSDDGYRAINWMTRPTAVDMPQQAALPYTWTFSTRSETLTITIADVLSDTDHHLDHAPPALVKKGTERELQAWLAMNPVLLAPGLVFRAREYPTGAGPVDLVYDAPDGALIPVEVKRVASINGVDQLSRYVEALATEFGTRPIRGLLAAFDVRPRARLLAESRGLNWVEVDKDRFLEQGTGGEPGAVPG
jgi:RecB family endonuclease NucS